MPKRATKSVTEPVTVDSVPQEEPQQEESDGIPLSKQSEIDEKFRRIFGILPPWDGMLMFILNEVHLDPFRFEDYLKRKHRDVNWSDTSMHAVIEKYYGKDAAEFTRSLI
jgi:hypothetical protein